MSVPVAVVDLGVSNLGSLCRALREVGAEPVVVSYTGVESYGRVVMPGVGSFATGMQAMHADRVHALTLAEGIQRAVERGFHVLGICLGLQLLATVGTEGDAETEGLDLIPGRVERLEPFERIPHVGWNEVLIDKPSPLLEGIPSGTDMYFTHSYALTPRDDADAIAYTPYAGGFTSVVQRGRVFGVQFHPEKSSAAGLRLLRNFVELAS